MRAPALLLLPLLASLSALAATTPAPTTPATPGAALTEQIARGETTYVLACAMCHGDRLEGVSAMALSGEDFHTLYRPLPPRALHDLIRDTMPYDRRGTLSAQEVLDVTAYLLHENGLPIPDGGVRTDTLDHTAPESVPQDDPAS
ncbi:c-type cytochrome [Deinococcus sedimenti]|uniref:c-type cytochrome n=1 Tax=Deinococcus sedimenti TaxID=1867090 RepID=UPI0016649039|nr:cytochrome c [Deinococcus sedimenti]